TDAQWDDLIGTNLKAPFFLAQAAAGFLRARQGNIINIVDIHADRPLRAHPVYSMAKAGLVMMTKALAGELGPEVRVNAVAPGAILWPETDMDAAAKEQIIERTFLKRRGSPADIAAAVLFLLRDATYMSGQVLTVDGGRSLYP
ncbi:MAG: SDR family oxidoreductase, partial [Gammaproteobacteria bacterium]